MLLYQESKIASNLKNWGFTKAPMIHVKMFIRTNRNDSLSCAPVPTYGAKTWSCYSAVFVLVNGIERKQVRGLNDPVES
jgi:hypothetical protein